MKMGCSANRGRRFGVLGIASLALFSCGWGCSSAHPESEDDSRGSSGSAAASGSSGSAHAGSSAGEGGKSGAGDDGKSGAGAKAGQGGSSSAGASGSGPSAEAGKDAGSAAQADAGAMPAMARKVFRVTSLALRDPHFYLNSTDITDKPFLGTSLNGSLIPGGLTMDYDMDGFVDVSMLAIVDPADSAATKLDFELVDGHCSANDPTHCKPHPNPGLHASWTATAHDDGACLELVAGSTTASFTPAPTVPQGPCFATNEERELVVSLGGVSIAMTNAKVAAKLSGDPPEELVDGLMMGFVTQQKAQETLLPDYLPLLAGTPLSDYLRMEDRDKDQSPSGDDGYWVYINFTATSVDYQE
jgi:hypothetical protein